ncbi:MAG: Mut-like protein [Firmicutes bacterium]|jgi:8-oxo-dGTP diphosphatase|nr:Mut-like protein [Bacillota bacterium]
MLHLRRHLSAGGLVLEDGYILLIRNRNGHWGLPKGHWEAGELLAETAVREVLEETGLLVEVGDLAFITEFRNMDAREHLVQFFFSARPTGGTLFPRPGEIYGVKWVPVAQVGEYIRWRPWLEPLTHWLQGGETRYHRFPDPAMNRME